MKTLHTWTCPVHGLVHKFTHDGETSTDEASTAIAIKQAESFYAKGCIEDVRTSKGIIPCAQHVTHLAEPAS